MIFVKLKYVNSSEANGLLSNMDVQNERKLLKRGSMKSGDYDNDQGPMVLQQTIRQLRQRVEIQQN